MIVTNIKWISEKNEKKQGFYMDGYLKENLDGVMKFLKLSYDCVGIISGHGKVRIGKSTLGMQVAYYLAWRLAGGIQKCHQEEKDGKQKWIIDKVKNPKKRVKFNLKENVCFSADELQTKAFRLYDKYGNNQVILYDEGRQGLDSARAMENINKGMQDFFQACGFMGHVILIVLPNFFRLHEDYAVARSLFLIDVYANKQHQRGFFSFYNEEQKEKLYFFGKKRIGIRAKYSSASENFWGRFSKWIPFNKEEYDDLKKESLKKVRQGKIQQKFKKQRDGAIYLLKKYTDLNSPAISQELSAVTGIKISERGVRYSISNITKQKAADID